MPRHGYRDVKVIAVEILAFVLSMFTFAEAVRAQGTPSALLRSAVLVLVVGFGVLLIRSVRRETRHREERERFTKELREANARLGEMRRFDARLLSVAAHQIKSPLAAIKGFVSLILEGLYGPVEGKVKEALGKVKKATDNLVELINTLLDLRRIDEGEMGYAFAPTDLVELATRVVEGLQPLAGEKSVELSFDALAREAIVNADAQRLQQVIQNVVDNAIKYTPKGFVRVTLAAESDDAVITVEDSGLGIPKALLPRLFDEFVRDERVRREVHGTGLGLYIARRILEAHEGKIKAESDGEGRGSLFTISVPRIQ